MSSVFISYTGLEEMANLIRTNCTAFNTVTYDSTLGILIKGADGKTYCRMTDIHTYFYQDGTDSPASATATLDANAYFAYLGITENGIIGCNSSGGAKWMLTRSYHGEYAFLYEVGSSNDVKAISQTSSSIQQYSLGGGTADSQTILNYFPLKPGTHTTDCTPNAFYSQTYQNDSFYGLVSYNGNPYILLSRRNG